MLHQPEPGAWEADRIHEQIEHEGVGSLSDEQIERQLQLVSERMERLRRSNSQVDQLMALGASIQISILEGEERTRRLLQEREARERIEREQRDKLMQWLQESHATLAALERARQETWWTRLRTQVQNLFKA